MNTSSSLPGYRGQSGCCRACCGLSWRWPIHLLDHRGLLLAALICTSLQVGVLEYASQACLTCLFYSYTSILRVQLRVRTCVCVGPVAWLWLAYVFAGSCGCWFVVLVLAALLAVAAVSGDVKLVKEIVRGSPDPVVLMLIGTVGVGI